MVNISKEQDLSNFNNIEKRFEQILSKVGGVIGITGGSCSGKTYISKAIINLLTEKRCDILSMDSYYKDLSSLDPKDRASNNFDHPYAIDYNLFYDHFKKLLTGETVYPPSYDFKTHTRSKDISSPISSSGKILIVEGIFLFHWQSIRNLFSTKVFVELSRKRRLSRRINRDTIERGRTVAEIREQFNSSVDPMHELYVMPAKEYADIVISGDETIDDLSRLILFPAKTYI